MITEVHFRVGRAKSITVTVTTHDSVNSFLYLIKKFKVSNEFIPMHKILCNCGNFKSWDLSEFYHLVIKCDVCGLDEKIKDLKKIVCDFDEIDTCLYTYDSKYNRIINAISHMEIGTICECGMSKEKKLNDKRIINDILINYILSIVYCPCCKDCNTKRKVQFAKMIGKNFQSMDNDCTKKSLWEKIEFCEKKESKKHYYQGKLCLWNSL